MGFFGRLLGREGGGPPPPEAMEKKPMGFEREANEAIDMLRKSEAINAILDRSKEDQLKTLVKAKLEADRDSNRDNAIRRALTADENIGIVANILGVAPEALKDVAGLPADEEMTFQSTAHEQPKVVQGEPVAPPADAGGEPMIVESAGHQNPPIIQGQPHTPPKVIPGTPVQPPPNEGRHDEQPRA